MPGRSMKAETVRGKNFYSQKLEKPHILGTDKWTHLTQLKRFGLTNKHLSFKMYNKCFSGNYSKEE